MANSHIEKLIHALREQIDQLAEEQSRAVRWAIYVGMSSDEGAEYDRRQKRIAELMRELKMLQESGGHRA